MGGDGVDTASFEASAAGVTVNLATGEASGGDAEGDVLSNIENITGSGFADVLTGDGAANLLSGGAGNDTLIGGTGNDLITGDAGNDTIDGGAGGGWTDTVEIDNPGTFGVDWTVELNNGSSIEEQAANYLELTSDANGTINLSDGSEITFEGIERIEW